MLHRIARPLTPADFAPYGEVIGADGRAGRPINRGSSLRVDDGGGALDLLAGGARPVLAVFRTRAQPPQGPWREFERHRLGSQSFVPLGMLRCLLLVARGDAPPDPTTLAAFVVMPGQGATLHAGTWHHPLIALDDGDVLVIERDAAGADCELALLPQPVTISLPR